MNKKRLEWLNQNRYRAYPFINDDGIICNGSRVPDCIIVDCLVTDTRSGSGPRALTVTRYDVEDEKTTIYFNYDGLESSFEILPSSDSSEYVRLSGRSYTSLSSGDLTEITFVCSRHDYILSNAGKGKWEFSGKVIPTKIVSVASTGIVNIHTNGSDQVNPEAVSSGSITLEDGYRTSPVIRNGRILVRVGTNYGKDPCHYERKSSTKIECDNLMFFFCGQNAINSGNVVLRGGPGVNVSQGTYTAREDILDTYGEVGIEAGETIPCISISATTSLLNIYHPSEATGTTDSASSS